jgi:formiminoglutamase
LNYETLREEVTKFDSNKKKHISKARDYVEISDKDVAFIIASIVKAGKTPIVIGGGHNNAYGNIKGTSLALNSKINVINFDAHSDFRPEEGRHSGNGFSYAFAEGFLRNYHVFGLHENYTSDKLLKTLKKVKNFSHNTYEAIEVRQEIDFFTALQQGLSKVSDKQFGIELDCDAIENIPSSAMTPSGFSVSKARQFVHHCGAHENASYLHICEAAPTKKSEKKIGKLITYLITDFIRAHGH